MKKILKNKQKIANPPHAKKWQLNDKIVKTEDEQVFTYIQMFEGIIDEVAVFATTADAQRQFKKYTGIEWKDYIERYNSSKKDCQAILGDKAGTAIYENQIIPTGGSAD